MERLRAVGRGVAVVTAFAVWAWPGSATAGVIVNASTSDTGVNSDFESTDPALSSNGRRVAFTSQATNLDPADADLTQDVYVKDLSTGDVVLVSVAPGNKRGKGRVTKGNFASEDPALSGDGLRVVFQSKANNLVRADEEAGTDIYLRDLSTGAIRLVSTNDAGTKGNSESFGPSLSTDGRLLAFSSAATNLDPADANPGMDVYVKDLSTGDVRLVSTGPAGRGNDHSFNAAITPDGTGVVFTSLATNLGGDTDADADVFLKNLSTGALTLVSADGSGVSGTGHSFSGVPSADGAIVAFTSVAADLDPADTDVYEDVYAKDLASGEVVLVSTAANGDGASGAHAVSADGLLVAFSSSSTTLVPSDRDVLLDVYVRNLVTGDLRLVSSAGGEKGNGDSFGTSFDASAGTVAFASTATNLVPADGDGRADVYVAPL